MFLARYVFEHTRDIIKPTWEVLDLCAGCGIVGFDFAFHCESELKLLPKKIDFIEVQDVYESHFLKNKALFKKLNAHFIQQNYNTLTSPNRSVSYDLILCNPPYFLKEHGKLSPSEFKNRCRFFIDSDLETLLFSIENTLAPNGRAYVLIKESASHNYFPIKSLKEKFKTILKINTVHNIRGTDVVQITKT